MFYVPVRPKALTEATGTARSENAVVPSWSSDWRRLLAIGYWLFAQRWLFLITGTGGNTIALA
jgi:hypothetical protein